MRLNRQLTLCLAAALYAVCVLSIILPDETDSISTTGSSTAVSPTASSPLEPSPDKAPPPAPLSQSLVGSTRAIPAAATTVVIETDIAENIAELDVDLLDQSHSSKEVQDSDGGQRQNYASKDSGATVLDHAPGTKGSVNLLVPDKDRYMLIPCASEKKWVVVSLSEDIHADAIAIANYEKFSSPTRDFLVLGSINYPSDTWVVLGNFTASHRNGEQLFEFHESHHVRYIKLRMMSHYGSEYYCTMSQIRVFGRTFTQVISQLEKTIEAEAQSPSPSPAVPLVPSSTTPTDSNLLCPFPAPESPISFFLHATTFESATIEVNDTCVSPSPADAANGTTERNGIGMPGTSGSIIRGAVAGESVASSNSSEAGTTTSLTVPPPLSSPSAGQGGANPSRTDSAKSWESPTDSTKGASDETKATPPTAIPAINNGGLDNFYIRMSKKLQVLETNVSQLEKVLHDLHRNHAISLQNCAANANAAAEALATLKSQFGLNMSAQANHTNDLVHQLVALHEVNKALQEQVEQLWDVIRTMKAGIMAALLLSAILLVFSICRWVFRCLTACHRRAARREWFRRLDVADTSEITSPHDEDTVDDDFNPLTQTMHHRVDRTIRFGSSFDDGAIQRNTMYRRYVVWSALG
ncbi:hypothetical protein, variant 1 [Aphanomyces invadans]|uniref:SUN domain-containing protein n=1 Tax=Aphanomyces invadans TaxID=157072 RepID=A0A024TKA1_9STRA|nr:hypothetical protein, variant 1 [Aphanomyces invadans]ETV94399.1 hypothetical protein, variant 1 [Aphanomyces invadans]|eukprot:XP_008877160.1 hypothetical protein, variant 1 [Aphanomyces invadans]